MCLCGLLEQVCGLWLDYSNVKSEWSDLCSIRIVLREGEGGLKQFAWVRKQALSKGWD